MCIYTVHPDTESRPPSTQRSSRDVIRRLRLEDGANVSMQGWDAVPMDGAFTVEAWFRLMVGRLPFLLISVDRGLSAGVSKGFTHLKGQIPML